MTDTAVIHRVNQPVRTGAEVLRFEFQHRRARYIKPRRAPNSAAVKDDPQVEEILRKERVFFNISEFQTLVKVYRGETLIAQGVAFCWMPDNPNKVFGRIHAIRNAVMDMPRAQRKEVFDAYEQYQNC